MLNIMYKLFLDRMVGQRKLHPLVHMCAAGNLDTDGAITHEMSTALTSRLVNFVVTEDLPFWLQWAQAGNIRSLITSFLQYRSSLFYTFDNTQPNQPFACPRTWEFVNDLLNVWNGNPTDKLIPIAGCVNLGAANEFLAFANLRRDLPRKDEVLANPEGCAVPGYENPGALYALTGAIGDWITEDNIGKLMKYIARIPGDFQVVTLRNAIRRKRALLSDPEVASWIQQNANVLL